MAISEPIGEKYVQAFALQLNISEMSVKTIWGKAHEKRLLHPSSRGGGQREGKEKRRESEIEKKSCCEQKGEGKGEK